MPEAKIDPVLRRFALRRLRLPVGNSILSLVVPDASDWIRRGEWTAATERGAEPPYWVQVWPASVAAARLLRRVGGLAGRRLLDLGCGIGVPGLAAANAGAEVTFADKCPEALAFAGWNGARVTAGQPPAVHQIDWTRSCVPGRFHILVLADVSYRAVHHAPLLGHLAESLDDRGVVVHADPHRPESDAFVRSLQRELHCLVVSRPTVFADRRADVRLCVGARAAATLEAWRGALKPAPTALATNG